MQELNWDDLKVFLVAAKQPSLAAAAELLKINSTTISRRVSALEEQLHGVLFDRSKRTWQLTSFGELICRESEPIIQQTSQVERLARVHTKALQGRLRITAPTACFSAILLPIINLFEKKHPNIQIELISTGKLLNLVSSEADVAFRVTQNPPLELVGYNLGRFGLAVYGHQKLVEQLISKQNKQMITCIDWLNSTPARWIEHYVGDNAKPLYCDSLITMTEMVKNGYGLAQLNCAIGDAFSELQRVPSSYFLSKNSLWLLTHIDVRNSERVKVFRDFVIEHQGDFKSKVKGEIDI